MHNRRSSKTKAAATQPPAARSSAPTGAEAFRIAAMRPLSHIALASIPKGQQEAVSGHLLSAFRASILGQPAEAAMMQAFALVPENPYLVARLAFFFEGYGNSRKAQEYAEKAKHLAIKAGIRLDALQRS